MNKSKKISLDEAIRWVQSEIRKKESQKETLAEKSTYLVAEEVDMKKVEKNLK